MEFSVPLMFGTKTETGTKIFEQKKSGKKRLDRGLTGLESLLLRTGSELSLTFRTKTRTEIKNYFFGQSDPKLDSQFHFGVEPEPV
jgi:hypothetical protein